MKNGDTVRVRMCLAGQAPRQWISAQVDLVAPNGRSIAVSAEEGLRTDQGYGFNAETGRDQLLLLKGERFYQDLATRTWWEIEEKLE